MRRVSILAALIMVAALCVPIVNGEAIPRSQPAATPAISLSPSQGKPGQSFTIAGTGFNCHSGNAVVVMTFDGTALNGSGTAIPCSGGFSVTARVPDVALGQHTVVASGYAPKPAPSTSATDTPVPTEVPTDTPVPTAPTATSTTPPPPPPTETSVPSATFTSVPTNTPVPTTQTLSAPFKPSAPQPTSFIPPSLTPSAVPTPSPTPCVFTPSGQITYYDTTDLYSTEPATCCPLPGQPGQTEASCTLYCNYDNQCNICPPNCFQPPPSPRGVNPVQKQAVLTYRMAVNEPRPAARTAALIFDGDRASAIFTVRAPSLPFTITQSASCASPPVAGVLDSCTITEVVDNRGAHTLDFSHTVTNHLATGVHASSTSASQGSASVAGSSVVWNNFQLAPGGSASASIQVSFTPPASSAAGTVALSDGISADAVDLTTGQKYSTTYGTLRIGVAAPGRPGGVSGHGGVGIGGLPTTGGGGTGYLIANRRPQSQP